MHALTGVQEPDFLRRTGATYKLGTEHIGWQGDGSRFLHAHGDIGMAIGAAPFYKFLLRESGARAGPPAPSSTRWPPRPHDSVDSRGPWATAKS